MLTWIIIIVLIVLIYIFIKARYMKHKIYAVFMVLLIIFLYATIANVVNTHNVDLKTFDGVVTGFKLYFSFLGNLFDNTKIIAGNVVKMDWNTNVTLG